VGLSLSERRDKATEAARERLQQAFPHLVGAVFSYGAVEFGAGHLAVWVLLFGPEDEIPEWFFPPARKPEWDMIPPEVPKERSALIPLLHEMAQEVRECFHAHDWPGADDVRVGFDSMQRVNRKGGWEYFK
jgi:hypothetical protein